MPSATTVDNTAAPAAHLWILGWILTGGCTHTPHTSALLLCIIKTQHSVISPVCLFFIVLYPYSSSQHYGLWLKLALHVLFEGECGEEAQEGTGFHCGLEEKMTCMVCGSALEMVAVCYPFPFSLWFCRFALGTLCRCNSFEIDLALCCFGWVFCCCFWGVFWFFFLFVFLNMHSSSYYII